jgi:hypothetical protein
MIIWNGWGFLVAVIVFSSSLLMELATESFYGDATYYQTHAWPLTVALLVAAVLVWVGAQFLDRRPKRVVIDKETGQELVLGQRDDLFFVPVRYWPLILVAAALSQLIARYLQSGIL